MSDLCVRSTPITRTWVSNGFSEELAVVVGIHQGSVLSLLLFIFVLEVPSRLSIGAAVCRILDDQCQVHRGNAGKVEDMKIRDGEEGPAREQLWQLALIWIC